MGTGLIVKGRKFKWQDHVYKVVQLMGNSKCKIVSEDLSFQKIVSVDWLHKAFAIGELRFIESGPNTVERFLQSIKFSHRIPGSTFSNDSERNDH